MEWYIAKGSRDGRPWLTYRPAVGAARPGEVLVSDSELKIEVTDQAAAFRAWAAAHPVPVAASILTAADGSEWIVSASGRLVRR